ncbi:MAG: EAL domain-containing protein [Gammaproteobacteria bacterium]
MNEIVIPGLYLLSGICACASINHLAIALRRPRDRVHLFFSGMCLLVVTFGVCQVWGYRAETVAHFALALKWSLAALVPFLILFLWFVAEYTGVRPRPLLAGLSVLFAVLFVVNLMQPYSLQYEDIRSLERLYVPWGEALAKPVGRVSAWFQIGVAVVFATFGFALYALGAWYRRTRERTALIMLLAVGLFVLASVEGILVRLSVIDFVILGPFGYLTMVIAMSVTLSYETRERLYRSESRFRSLVEQSPFSIQMLAPDGRTLTVNPAWERLWGIKLDALAGYNLLEDRQLIDKGAMPYVARGFAGVATEVPTIIYNPADNPVVRGPYRDRWIRAHIYPIKDGTNRVSEVILMHEDVTEKKHVEDAIRQIAAGVSAQSGQLFFRRLVQHLAKLFDADYAYIGMLGEGNPEQINTLVVCAHGEIVDNFSYALAGTPCANVVGQETRVYPRDVQRLFPEDLLLAEIGAEAYIGTCLFGAAGHPLGLIAVVDTKPLLHIEPMRNILDIFAARAAAEIERLHAEQALHQSTEQLHATIEFTPNVAIQWYDQDGRILFWNSASESMFGWRKEEAIGKTLDQLIHTPEETAAFLAVCSKVQRTGKPNEPTEYTFRHRDGTRRTGVSTIFALPNVDGRPRFTCMNVDITKHKGAEAQIHRMAYQDGLTELANRVSLQEHLGQVLEQSGRSGNQGAMLLIDLDHFKTINDALGHDVGDDVLRAVARRLSGTVRERGFLARLGGDEFVVVMAGLSPDEVEAAAAADALAREIATRLADPIVLGERVFNVGASIGAALFQDGHVAGPDLLRRADIALYRAKNLGRGNVQFFLPALQAVADQRLRLERELRAALANRELELYFQPQVTAAGQVFGAEALLRWRHPELGVVSSSKFIPVAEETGLIHTIGEWVLRQACERLAAWSRAGTGLAGYLTINVSPWQFARRDFVQSIRALIAEQGIDPARLVLELTESALLYDVHETIEKLAALRSGGLKVSLDDFGTGYSSLAYLKDLPLDILKIDKAFVDELETEQKYPIVDTIITLGRHMNLMVIAEGVETTAQRDLLVNLGCNGFQGYLFCRPLPEDEFLRWNMLNTRVPTENIESA